jgi:hypothetical protein
VQFLYLHAIVSPGKPRLLLLLKKKEEKGGGKGQGQGQGHNDDDVHGRSKKIAGTHNNIFLLSCCGDLSAISMDLMFFVWRFFLQFPG